MHSRPVKFIAPLMILAALFAGGCATPAKSTAMVAAPMLEAENRHEGSIGLNVTGGSETTAASASQISNENFAAALRESVEKSGLFSNVLSAGEKGDYHLDVSIVRVDQPMVGFSMTVTVETTWNLSRLSDGKVLWRKGILSTYTAPFGESVVGVTRLRLANEGAARENIRNAIAQMGALSLTEH